LLLLLGLFGLPVGAAALFLADWLASAAAM
jgi:hypothetical protein